MSRKRRRPSRRKLSLRRKIVLSLLAIPLAYLSAALVGSLIPVNRGWTEPAQGTTIYLADNGIHADIVMPVAAQGLDWRPWFPAGDFAAPPPNARWIAFGAGEEKVYLETPRWRDIRPATVWSALTGGKRVMHVEYVVDPRYAAREIRLRPEEYRRLWAAIRGVRALEGGDADPYRSRRLRPSRRFLPRRWKGERFTDL